MQTETQIGKQRKINRGDIYWIQPEEAGKSELGFYPDPYVIVQDNIFNTFPQQVVIINYQYFHRIKFYSYL